MAESEDILLKKWEANLKLSEGELTKLTPRKFADEYPAFEEQKRKSYECGVHTKAELCSIYRLTTHYLDRFIQEGGLGTKGQSGIVGRGIPTTTTNLGVRKRKS